MKPCAVVIGAGINGLVAANYLQRNGFKVLLLEKQERTGGACTHETIALDGQDYEYPNGASVFGLMQDFVFQETGLSARLRTCVPDHPAIVYSEADYRPCLMYEDVTQLSRELNDKWGEGGNVAGFYAGLDCVRSFLIDGYRAGRVPDIQQAHRLLGTELTELWITGSARRLLDHFFTSQPMKVFSAIDVIESGSVSIDQPFSAFTIPLMSSGTVFGGKWGFVDGGIWQVAEVLTAVNAELGVKVIAPATVSSVSDDGTTVTYTAGGCNQTIGCDVVLFATEPLTAARMLGDQGLLPDIGSKNFLGTSGKALLFFRHPVKWRQRDISCAADLADDFDLASRFLLNVNTLEDLETRAQSIITAQQDYLPGFAEIYCEGAAHRRFHPNTKQDMLAVFLKNLALDKKGADLPDVRASIQEQILSLIENPEDLIDSILFTPRDLQERFGFPGGNIDHIELCAGQTYFWRHYSPCPQENFYQFGSSPRVFYGAAGAYPCGSVAGTPGYMCAQEVLKNFELLEDRSATAGVKAPANQDRAN